MNKNLTEIVIVLDGSGSMGPTKKDTIGGFNSFLEEQRSSKDGEAIVTLVQFNGHANVILDGKPVELAEPLSERNYRTFGSTALLDAIGTTIERLEERYTNETDPLKVPGRVLFAIITDGEENASLTFSREQVEKMIKHQTNRHGFEFIFLGANLDSVAAAKSIGINSDQSFNFGATGDGISDTYAVFSNAALSYRSSGVAAMNLKGTSLENLNPQVKN